MQATYNYMHLGDLCWLPWLPGSEHNNAVLVGVGRPQWGQPHWQSFTKQLHVHRPLTQLGVMCIHKLPWMYGHWDMIVSAWNSNTSINVYTWLVCWQLAAAAWWTVCVCACACLRACMCVRVCMHVCCIWKRAHSYICQALSARHLNICNEWITSSIPYGAATFPVWYHTAHLLTPKVTGSIRGSTMVRVYIQGHYESVNPKSCIVPM